MVAPAGGGVGVCQGIGVGGIGGIEAMIQLSHKESSHRNQVVHGPSDVTRVESSVNRVLEAKEFLEDILEMKMSHTWTSLLSRL